jgi:hypothetical protein
MCGYPLGLVGRLLRKARHPACLKFNPFGPMPPREAAEFFRRHGG